MFSVLEVLTNLKPTYVVNCAALHFPRKVNQRGVAIDWVMENTTNLLGAYYVARECVRTKIKKMVFVSSVAGLRGIAGKSGYCASKAGVISLVQSLAAEGHKAYCVSPSRVNTGMVPKEPGEDMKKRLEPDEVARTIADCLLDKYNPGANVIIRKKGYKTIREIMKPWES